VILIAPLLAPPPATKTTQIKSGLSPTGVLRRIASLHNSLRLQLYARPRQKTTRPPASNGRFIGPKKPALVNEKRRRAWGSQLTYLMRSWAGWSQPQLAFHQKLSSGWSPRSGWRFRFLRNVCQLWAL